YHESATSTIYCTTAAATTTATTRRGADSRNALNLQSSLAGLDMALGRQEQALRRLRGNLERFEKKSGGIGRDQLTTLLNLAELELSRREMTAAKGHYQRALEVIGDPDSEPRMSSAALARLGTIASEEGDLEGAERLLQRARIVQVEQFGADSDETAWTIVQLGILRRRQERFADALEMLHGIASTIDSARQSSLVSTYHSAVAETHAALGQHEQALISGRRAVDVTQVDQAEHAAALFALARVERAAGREAEAVEHAQTARERFVDSGDPRSREVDDWLATGARQIE
ncbi:MAG: tetratricopeptide repeat protein, partial [Myxococcota bacterium]